MTWLHYQETHCWLMQAKEPYEFPRLMPMTADDRSAMFAVSGVCVSG